MVSNRQIWRACMPLMLFMLFALQHSPGNAQVAGLRGIRKLAIDKLEVEPLAAARTLAITSLSTLAPNVACACSGCYVLPVKLLQFEGNRLNKAQVLLKWRTVNEFQNKGFEVQRSLGNTDGFVNVAFMPAQTNPAPVYDYELIDMNAYSSISYYRLKQVDFDGRYSFSEIVSVKGYTEIPTITVFPNPVMRELKAVLTLLQPGKATIIISDAAQKVLWQQQVILQAGINNISIPAAQWTGGVYLLQVLPEHGSKMVTRFVKL
ncbi:MAG: T9SS type A sorting domain-containing protein [Sphingobacteriales bacterium]|nr:MAG: T9SS type A sorting domain-containing protein [Sphingobacteriales bacterium]